MTGIKIVTTTVGSEADARELARVLVEKRLAACVQVGPIVSTYRWDGEIQTDNEWELSIKTAAAVLDDVTAWVEEHHPYDTPQLLVTAVEGGSKPYLEWVRDETRASNG